MFWWAIHIFSINALDLGWGFFPLVVSLPFVPFILVWLGVQFTRHYKCFRAGTHLGKNLIHCLCIFCLFSLFVFHFIY
ncbi:hypothetical protein FS418_11825 [Shewanella sp. YLB-09]|uniref:Uncharacterized protein n=1 Tax=Shewanella eurypsychrophilus TaxID=2593656 RepID=A0A550AN21_9GAMM|nr:hypothetical protein FS418_11825 [Shewanella sp. YLB-09]